MVANAEHLQNHLATVVTDEDYLYLAGSNYIEGVTGITFGNNQRALGEPLFTSDFGETTDRRALQLPEEWDGGKKIGDALERDAHRGRRHTEWGRAKGHHM